MQIALSARKVGGKNVNLTCRNIHKGSYRIENIAWEHTCLHAVLYDGMGCGSGCDCGAVHVHCAAYLFAEDCS
jgi:hypothetical protein